MLSGEGGLVQGRHTNLYPIRDIIVIDLSFRMPMPSHLQIGTVGSMLFDTHTRFSKQRGSGAVLWGPSCLKYHSAWSCFLQFWRAGWNPLDCFRLDRRGKRMQIVQDACYIRKDCVFMISTGFPSNRQMTQTTGFPPNHQMTQHKFNKHSDTQNRLGFNGFAALTLHLKNSLKIKNAQ